VETSQTEVAPKKKRSERRRKCRRCGQLKPKKLMVANYPWCKSCHCAYQTVYREKNREAVLARKRAASKEATHARQRALGERFCPVCNEPVVGRVNKVFCGPRCCDTNERYDSYGLSPAEFREVTKEGCCPLCLRKVIKWQVDHDHATGETMGPVCSRCNQYLLAGSGHDVEIAKRLVEFLSNPPVRKLTGEKRYAAPARTSKLHRIWLWTGESNLPIDTDPKIS
jgi:hypothetical protein